MINLQKLYTDRNRITYLSWGSNLKKLKFKSENGLNIKIQFTVQDNLFI